MNRHISRQSYTQGRWQGVTPVTKSRGPGAWGGPKVWKHAKTQKIVLKEEGKLGPQGTLMDPYEIPWALRGPKEPYWGPLWTHMGAPMSPHGPLRGFHGPYVGLFWFLGGPVRIYYWEFGYPWVSNGSPMQGKLSAQGPPYGPLEAPFGPLRAPKWTP